MRDVAGALTDDVVVALRELAGNIVQAAVEKRFAEYLAADTAFHLRVLEVTGNRKLLEVVAELRQQTRLVGLAHLVEAETLVQTSMEHAELVDLLVAGDGVAAEALMRRHIRHIGGVWSGRDED